MVNSAKIAALLAACCGVGVRLFSVVYTSVALIPPAAAAFSRPNTLIISPVEAFVGVVASDSVAAPPAINLCINPPILAFWVLFDTVLIGLAEDVTEGDNWSAYLSGSFFAKASNNLYGSNSADDCSFFFLDLNCSSISTLAAYSGSDCTFLLSILAMPNFLISSSTSEIFAP